MKANVSRSPVPSKDHPPTASLTQTPEIIKQTPSQKIIRRKGTGFVRKERPPSESSESLQEGPKNIPMSGSESIGKSTPYHDQESKSSSVSSDGSSVKGQAQVLDLN